MTPESQVVRSTYADLERICDMHRGDLLGLCLEIAAADEREIPLILAVCSAWRIVELSQFFTTRLRH